jgi:hypothetical protein
MRKKKYLAIWLLILALAVPALASQIVTNQSASAAAVTISGTPTLAGSWAFVDLVGQYNELTQITPGAGWTVIDQVDIQEAIGHRMLVGTPLVSVSSPMSFATGFHAIMGFFNVAVPAVSPVIVQTQGVSNLFTNFSVGPFTVTAGNNLLVVLQNSDTTQDVPITSVVISDNQGNSYLPLAVILSGAGNTQGAMYEVVGVSGGSLTISVTLTHRARGGFRIFEVSGMGSLFSGSVIAGPSMVLRPSVVK